MKKSFIYFILTVMLLLLSIVSNCSSYNKKIRNAENLFNRGAYKKAADSIKEEAITKSKNQLLYLMEAGLMLFQAEDYQKAIQVFSKADTLADSLYARSISGTGLSLLINDRSQDYRGEDFERIMINTYLGLAYLAIKKTDDAVIEFKKVNNKLMAIKRSGAKKYKENSFARLMAGISYLSVKNYNAAAVEFRKVLLVHKRNQLAMTLLQKTALMDKDINEYKKLTKHYKKRIKQKEAAWPYLIVIYQNGRSPIKTPRGFRAPASAWPRYISRYSSNSNLHITIYKETKSKRKILTGNYRTYQQYNLESTAIRTLNENYASLVAKSTTRYIGKRVAGEVLYHQLRKKNQAFAILAWFASLIYAETSERADLRCWHTLPRDLQLAFIPLAPATYKVILNGNNSRKSKSYTIKLEKGKQEFILYRSLN